VVRLWLLISGSHAAFHMPTIGSKKRTAVVSDPMGILVPMG